MHQSYISHQSPQFYETKHRKNHGGTSTSNFIATPDEHCLMDDEIPIYEKSYLYLYTIVDPTKLLRELPNKSKMNATCIAQVISPTHAGPVVNGFCSYHDCIINNRKWIQLKSNGIEDIIPVAVNSIPPKNIKSIGMLFSFFRGNDVKIYEKLLINNEAYMLTDNINKVENEIKNICKGMSIMLDERQYNKPEYAQLIATYKTWAAENRDLLHLESWNKMYFLMEVDTEFYDECNQHERFKTQKWFNTAEKVNGTDIYILYVPFTFLCDFDKIRLASFIPSTLLEECHAPNKMAFGNIPNITFYNGIIQMGGGTGVMYDCPQLEEGYYYRFSELVALTFGTKFERDVQISPFESKPITCKEPRVGELEKQLNKPILTKYTYRI